MCSKNGEGFFFRVFRSTTLSNMEFRGFILLHFIILFPWVCLSFRRQDNVTVPDCTSGLYLDQVYYEKEILLYHTGKPFNLVLHKYSGTLFFSYTATNQTHVDFKIAACNLKNKKCLDVTGVPGGYALAYDVQSDNIYFGGHDGIYMYSFTTNNAEFFAEDDKSILDIFVRKHFYYVRYPSLKLYVYNGDKFTPVQEAIGLNIERFFIKKNKDIYFSNATGLSKIEELTRTYMFLFDEGNVRQIAEDKYGDLYIATDKGLYVEMNSARRMKKLTDINQTYGLTFDEYDNIIYSDAKGVYRLKESKNAIHCHFRRKYNLFLGP